MNQVPGLFKSSALIAFISAIVHFVGSAVSGFGPAVMPMLIGGVLWLVFAGGLRAGWRWLAYFAFLLAVIGGLITYAQLASAGASLNTVNLAIMLLNLVLMALLFLIIWRRNYVQVSD